MATVKRAKWNQQKDIVYIDPLSPYPYAEEAGEGSQRGGSSMYESLTLHSIDFDHTQSFLFLYVRLHIK